MISDGYAQRKRFLLRIEFLPGAISGMMDKNLLDSTITEAVHLAAMESLPVLMVSIPQEQTTQA